MYFQRGHVESVFFDLEKAYDTLLKPWILQDLHEAGLRDNLPNFIEEVICVIITN